MGIAGMNFLHGSSYSVVFLDKRYKYFEGTRSHTLIFSKRFL